MAEEVNVDPLGSCMMVPSVLPEKFLGLVAIWCDEPTVTPV